MKPINYFDEIINDQDKRQQGLSNSFDLWLKNDLPFLKENHPTKFNNYTETEIQNQLEK